MDDLTGVDDILENLDERIKAVEEKLVRVESILSEMQIQLLRLHPDPTDGDGEHHNGNI